jgi:hypothetical protein
VAHTGWQMNLIELRRAFCFHHSLFSDATEALEIFAWSLSEGIGNPHRGTSRHGGNFRRRRDDLDARANQSSFASVRPAAHRRKQPRRAPLVRPEHRFQSALRRNLKFAAEFNGRPMRPAFDPGRHLIFSSRPAGAYPDHHARRGRRRGRHGICHGVDDADATTLSVIDGKVKFGNAAGHAAPDQRRAGRRRIWQSTRPHRRLHRQQSFAMVFLLSGGD